jgi:hypothetical protein
MKHTRGPWRWADQSATFGTMEDPKRMRTLEHNPTHPGSLIPVVRNRNDGPRVVLRLESRDEIREEDAELIRRAPELAAALHEMLDMFHDDLEPWKCLQLRELAGER